MGQGHSSRPPQEGSSPSSSPFKGRSRRKYSVSPLRSALLKGSSAGDTGTHADSRAETGDKVSGDSTQAPKTEMSSFLQLEPPCFYAVTSLLFLNELPTLMAVCRRFRDLINTDECVLRCEGLFVDGSLWFDRLENPPGWALLKLGSLLEKQAPHLHTIAVSSGLDRKPPPQLQQLLTLNAGICRALWVYDSPGGFGTYLEDLVSQMHELREVGVVGEGMDSLFVRRFLKQLFSNGQSRVKTIWLGVGDHSVECLRAAVLKTTSMSNNSQSVFATLQALHLNLGGYSCGLLALTGFLELLQKQLRDTCTVYLEGTLNISSFPSLSAASEGTEKSTLASVEEAYDRVFRYNSAGPAVDGGTDFCSQMDQDVLLNSLRSSKHQRTASFCGTRESLQQQRAPASAFSRFRRHSFSLEGFTLRKSVGGPAETCSAMAGGLSLLKLDRLIEFRCSLRRCEGEYEAAGERRLHRLLAATFSSFPKDAVTAYNDKFRTSYTSMPSLVVELPRHSRFPVPLALLSQFKAMLSAFLAEFGILLLQLPTGPPFECSFEGGSGDDAGVKEVLDFLGESNRAKVAGIQLDLDCLRVLGMAPQSVVGSAFETGGGAAVSSRTRSGAAGGGGLDPAGRADSAPPKRLGSRETAAREGHRMRATAHTEALAQLSDALSEGLESLQLQRGSWWVLRLKGTRRTVLTTETWNLLEALLIRQGEPGVIEWQLLRDGTKGQQRVASNCSAFALGEVDRLLRERHYKRVERFSEWFDTVTYVKEEVRS